MRKINDEIRENEERELRAACFIEGKKGLEYRVGNHKIFIPKKILYMNERLNQYYEVDSIEDIRANYPELSRPIMLPLKLITWQLLRLFPWTLWDVLKTDLKDPLNEEGSFISGYKMCTHHPFETVKSFIFLNNAYLDNFNYIKTPNYEVCEFEISDNTGSIPGFAITRDNDEPDMAEVLAKEVRLADNSPRFQAFDIEARALPPDYSVWREEGKVPRGEMLRVFQIHTHRGKPEDMELMPMGNYDDVEEPVYVRQ